MVIINHFLNSQGNGFHIATRHPTVSVQPFINHDHIASLLGHAGIIDRQPSTDIDQVILFSAHPGAIGIITKFTQDLGN